MAARAKTAVLTQDDFLQTIAMVNPQAETRSHRDTLQELSRTRTSSWNNTLEKNRYAAATAKVSRQAQLEEALAILDEQETAYHQEQHRKSLNRASNILYQGDQRVKEMHTAISLSATIKEREAQMVLNRRKREMMNEVEAQNIELIKAEHARALQREIDEQNIRKQMASEQRRMNQEQYSALAERKKIERYEEIKEGEAMKVAVALSNAELDEQARLRAEAVKKSNYENAAHLREQLAFKAEQARLDVEFDKKIEQEAEERDALAARRKAFEKARAEERKRILETQAKRLFDQRAALEKQEEDRSQRELEEIMRREDLKHQTDAQRKIAQQQQMVQVRAQQLVRKRQLKEQQEAEDAQINSQWREAQARFEREEQDILRLERQKALEVRRANAQKIIVDRNRDYDEAARDRAEVEEYKYRQQEELAIYEGWVDSQLEEARAKGRSLVPLYKTFDVQHKREAGLTLNPARLKQKLAAPVVPPTASKSVKSKGSPKP